jgi:hypothetical protein
MKRALSDKETRRRALGHSLRRAGCSPLQILAYLLADTLDIPGEEALIKIMTIISAWQDHPDYDYFYQAHYGRHKVKEEPLSALALGVFEHEPNQKGQAESYVITSVREILNHVEWGERSLGKFIDIRPFPHDLHVEPGMTIRVSYLSFSLKGSGRAFQARMRLKKLLPDELKHLVKLARSFNRKSLGKLKTIKGYTRKKAAFFGEHVSQEEIDHLKEILVDYTQFWDAATGKMHPNDAPSIFKVHQMDFFNQVGENATIHFGQREADEYSKPYRISSPSLSL